MAASSDGTTEKSSMTRITDPIDLATKVAGQGAKRHPDCDGEGRRGKADRQRNPGAIDDAGEEVAPKIIYAEPELRRRECQRLRQISLVCGIAFGQEWRQGGSKDDDCQHKGARDSRAIRR